jgi:NAD+ synthase (glutamine-hydrolysing)
VDTYDKHHLPTYSVFDEARVFIPGHTSMSLNLGGCRTGFLICEDLWRVEGPVAALTDMELDAVVVINASPFDRTKDDGRYELVSTRAREIGAPLLYVNLVGGQDDLVFDGGSMVVDAQGQLLARAAQFTEGLLVVDIEAPAFDDEDVINIPVATDIVEPFISVESDELATIWDALVLGTRDYIEKNGFPSVTLGLSGGIDSAVVAAIACDAIGAERVYGVSMPSRYSSDHSQDDAADLANLLGCHYRVEPIADLVLPYETQLGLTGLSAENIQARARGMILMALSNAEGHLVLTTGNKSEVAVGYCTMYGDTVGGFAPIKDVPKTLVWELARYRNRRAEALGDIGAIPVNSIDKPPSAELRPGQVDQDSLPPYEILDAILELLVDHRASVEDIVGAGFDADTVARIATLVSRSEWKRRQGAIGPRITTMAFGRERRLPLTARMTEVG